MKFELLSNLTRYITDAVKLQFKSIIKRTIEMMHVKTTTTTTTTTTTQKQGKTYVIVIALEFI